MFGLLLGLMKRKRNIHRLKFKLIFNDIIAVRSSVSISFSIRTYGQDIGLWFRYWLNVNTLVYSSGLYFGLQSKNVLILRS